MARTIILSTAMYVFIVTFSAMKMMMMVMMMMMMLSSSHIPSWEFITNCSFGLVTLIMTVPQQ